MKIDKDEKEQWVEPRILVLLIDTVYRNIDENGWLKFHASKVNGKVVAIERLSDEYCAVMLAGFPKQRTNKGEVERIDDGRRIVERSKTQADEDNPAGDPSQVCPECASALGYRPKAKVVGVWMGECDVCHEYKPCTDLQHDWVKREKTATNE